MKALESFGKVWYNEHPRGRGWSCFGCLNRRDVAIQSRKTRWNLVQYLKISLDIVLDAKSFVVLGKSGFWEREKAENLLIIKWKRIWKLACKDAHADCSASLCRRQRSAKRHLEKGDARKEYTSGLSASFMFRYLPLISSKIRSVITPWKPFDQKARVAKRRESVRKQLSVVFPRAWPSRSENRIPQAHSIPRSAKYSSYLRREELLASSRTTRNA